MYRLQVKHEGLVMANQGDDCQATVKGQVVGLAAHGDCMASA